MKQNLEYLKRLREDKEKMMEQKRIKIAEFEEANKQLLQDLARTDSLINDTERVIREEAVSIYESDPEKNKSVGYGVKIRIMRLLHYDPTAALGWAKEHNMALSLDKRAFESIAKVEDIPCVEVEESPAATIPTKIEVE